ncbi:hypothetical protein [Flavobacterium sp.]|uniref:hypothetical protein n=1 Tax=Flavobacterium sp. TaxID=239 RepID=UPI00404807DD
MFWIILSLFAGITYMRLLLGKIPDENSYKGLGFFLNLFYSFGILYFGLILGFSIAVLFFLIDHFLLRKKLNNNSLLIRFLTLFVITLTIGIIHYILEKVLDVI